MNMDLLIRSDIKEQLQVEETDDSCRVDFIEIVPVARNTDGSCTTECVSGDWFDEVKQENLAAVVKQEPDNVCCVIFATFSISLQKEFIQILGVRSRFWCHGSYFVIAIAEGINLKVLILLLLLLLHLCYWPFFQDNLGKPAPER